MRLPKHRSSSRKDPVVPLERNLRGHPVARLCGKSNSRVLLKYIWEKFQIGNACSSTEKNTILVMWTINKLAGKKQNISLTWKISMKDVDLGEPTSFLDHVTKACLYLELLRV